MSVDTIPDASNSFLSFEFGIAEAYASTGTVATDNVSKALDGFVGIFNLLLGVITVLVTPFVMFAGWLLSPDWVSGRIFGLQKPMYDLWRTIANIVYFIYAMALIIIAIATIFNSQNY